MRKKATTQGSRKTSIVTRAEDRDPLVLKSLPMRARPGEESLELQAKREATVAWMKERGIDERLARSIQRRVEAKQPLPGTVIYFSRSRSVAA